MAHTPNGDPRHLLEKYFDAVCELGPSLFVGCDTLANAALPDADPVAVMTGSLTLAAASFEALLRLHDRVARQLARGEGTAERAQVLAEALPEARRLARAILEALAPGAEPSTTLFTTIHDSLWPRRAPSPWVEIVQTVLAARTLLERLYPIVMQCPLGHPSLEGHWTQPL